VAKYRAPTNKLGHVLLTLAEQAQIRKLYKMGNGITKIGRILHIPHNRVRGFLHENGLIRNKEQGFRISMAKRRTTPRDWPKYPLERVRKDLSNSKGEWVYCDIDSIAKEYGGDDDGGST